jgi:hypothetical protein
MKQLILAVALVLGGATIAHAQPGQPGPQRPQAGMRSQHHRQEMRQRLVEKFDRDGDGQLRGSEKRAARQFVKRKRFERRMDALRRFDANQDGWLSPEEQEAAREAFRAKRQARRDRRAGN